MYKFAEKSKCGIVELYGTLGDERRKKKWTIGLITLRGELEKAIDEPDVYYPNWKIRAVPKLGI
ncbi:hypothetical protein M5W68_17830 [Paenibacillus larvae]|uniref:hypothetical protein n=1 Tax=Paenibacillus larvae TaxID=1464 RepID=UPI002281D6AA|nr:hypothetical protein [Paenibacillus larvae]MCY9511756.1 hypothetical protein [Paenibacillus larvae]MCY9526913.1 hypothetical protein [Paenibacillus larvae]